METPQNGMPVPRIGPTDLENRANIDSLDILQHKRRQIKAKLRENQMEYLFGSGGKREEAVRRRHRDGIYRLLMTESKETAHNKLETLANSDARHVTFCDHLQELFVEWYSLHNDLEDVEERIESRITELQSYNKEVGLAR